MAGQADGEVYNNSFLLYPGVKLDKGLSATNASTFQNNVYLAQGAVSSDYSNSVASSITYRNNLFAGTKDGWPETGQHNYVKPDVHPLKPTKARAAAVNDARLDYLRPANDEVAKKGLVVSRDKETDILGAARPANGLTDLGAFQVSDVSEAQADPKASILLNGGFEEKAEDGKTPAWTLSEGAHVDGKAGQTDEGPHGLVLDSADATATQVIHNVGVNHTYRLVAVVKPDKNGTYPTVSISNPKGATTDAVTKDFTAPSGTDWVPVSTLMRTAWDADKLTVTIKGPGSVDNLHLIPVDDYVVDGSFESRGNSPWSSDARSEDAVSGGLALTGNSENHEVVVPKTGETYEVAAC